MVTGEAATPALGLRREGTMELHQPLGVQLRSLKHILPIGQGMVALPGPARALSNGCCCPDDWASLCKRPPPGPQTGPAQPLTSSSREMASGSTRRQLS